MWEVEMGGATTASDGKKYFTRKIYIRPSDVQNIRGRFNNTDVYATVMAYEDIKKQNATNMIGQMYIDLDMSLHNEDDYQKLTRDLRLIVTYLGLNYGIAQNMLKFYFTGSKGFHIMISPIVFDIEPNDKLNQIYKEIAKELNDTTINKPVDIKIYDTKRLFRLPNSINGKSGKYKVPISYENIYNFSYQNILDYASSPKPLISIEKPVPIQKAIDKYNMHKDSIANRIAKKMFIPTDIDLDNLTFLPCIQKLYREGATDGNRNQSCAILSSALLQKGIDINTTMTMVQKWNAERNSPSSSENEVTTTVNSAYSFTMEGLRYGCASLKDAGLCVPEGCPVLKGKN